MALEDYPFRVEKMGPRGEIGHVLCYADNVEAFSHEAFFNNIDPNRVPSAPGGPTIA